MKKSSIRDYVLIARPSHWIKNLFILPGFMAAQIFEPSWTKITLNNLAVAIFSTCLIASANYVINEWFDRKNDAFHPSKKNRPSVSGRITRNEIISIYFILTLSGLLTSSIVSVNLMVVELFLLFMGWLYNIPPFRLKDKAYLDVISESINNPIRLFVGWVCVIDSSIPPLSLIIGYWLGGAFLMNVKRYAELRSLHSREIAAKYRKSFGFYTEAKLLSASFFYAIMSFFFIAIFMIRYQSEYLLVTPLLAYLYVFYFNLGMQDDSIAQKPERLYREKRLFILIGLIVVLFFTFSLIEIPYIEELIIPRAK